MRIRAYFSHKYEAFSINGYFYELLTSVEDRDIQFEVDAAKLEGKDVPTNLTRIERKIRDSDAFVGVFPFQPDPKAASERDDLREQSRYLRMELDMARRAGLPCIVFSDERYGDLFEPSENVRIAKFDSREFPSDVRDSERKRFSKRVDEFFEQVEGWIDYKLTPHQKKLVGVLLSTRDYDISAQSKIWKLLEKYNWNPELLAWPPQLQSDSFQDLRRFDWILLDSGDASEKTGVGAFLHAKMIPLMRFRKGGRGSPRPGSFHHTLYGGFEVGYGDPSKEGCWRSPAEIEPALEGLLEWTDCDSSLISSKSRAKDYFRRAAELDIEVFFSCAGHDLDFAEDLAAALKKRFRKVFYYKHPGDLRPGNKWMDDITESINKAKLGVILFSQAWIKSGYCQYEGDLILRRRLDREMKMVPVKRAQDCPDPDTLKGYTYVKPWNFDDDPERVSEFIVRDYQNPPDAA